MSSGLKYLTLNILDCITGPVYQPSIEASHKFYAVSAFLYSLQTLNVMADDGSFSPGELRNKATQYCSKVGQATQYCPKVGQATQY